jgi:hypothetical protein
MDGTEREMAMLKQETVTIDGTEYTVSELPIRVMLPLIGRMETDQMGAQLDMLGESCAVGGVKLGAQAQDLGMSRFLLLVQAVLRVNGVSQGAPGKAN